ncbi:MAG: 30S ribosomal protein S15 [Candidatus Diapherotrites archaeon]|nr:30S ribosomal protein S15 [Candidatus Diapherotrites archaeon]
MAKKVIATGKTKTKRTNAPKKEKAKKEKPKKELKSLTKKEIEEHIVSLANAGHTPSEIGLILKEEFGIYDVKAVIGKKVQQVLAEHNLLPQIPEDLFNLIKKAVKIRKHMETNRKDYTAKRGYMITISKIRRLARYYKRKGKLPKDWYYDEATASLLVR